MCLKLLNKNRKKLPQYSTLPLFEAGGQSLINEKHEEKPTDSQVMNQLVLEKTELEKINETLRKHIAEQEARINELEVVPHKDFTSISPIIVDSTRKVESDNEKRLVNSMLDILTLLDFNELDSKGTSEMLSDSIRGVVSNALSYHGISLYRDEAVPYNPKWHQLITWETTEEPSLHNFIKQSLSTGVKLDNNRCLRPEKVSVYKFK